MPSPKTAIHISDAVSALLMGHQHRYETSSEVSFSFEACDEANRKESIISEKGMIIPKHGFTIESSPIHAESLSSQYTTTILDTNTSISPLNPNTDVQTHMEIEAQQSSVLPMPLPQRRPRSGSEGLDYLAFLAEQERQSLELPTAIGHPIPVGSSSNNSFVSGDPIVPPQQDTSEHPQSIPVACCVVTPPTTIVNNPPTSSSSSSSSSSSDTDDSEAMPPPQPRRPRSISNPDYMMSMQYQRGADRAVAWGIPTMKSQQHFVLPPHLLREELAKARSAVVRKAAAEITMTPYCYNRYGTSTNRGSSFCGTSTIPEHAVYLQSNNDHYDYVNHTSDDIEEEEEYDDDELRPESGDEYDVDDDVHDEADIHDAFADQDVADSDNNKVVPMDASLSSMELLRRARSRLFEDLLSETNSINGTNDRSITILPHTLSKYKMVRLGKRDLSVCFVTLVA